MTYSDSIILELDTQLARNRQMVDEVFAQIGIACMSEGRFPSEHQEEWKQELQKRWEDAVEIEKEIRSLPNTYICQKCGAGVTDDASYCVVCGGAIDWEMVTFTGEVPESGMIICPACGQKLEEDACFCIKCGKKIENAVFDLKTWKPGMW